MLEYTQDFKWKNKKLYLRDKYTGVSVIKVKDQDNYPEMYQIKWEEPLYGFSEDFYNLSRAKDNAVKYVQKQENKRSRTETTMADTASGIGRTCV